MTRTLPTGRSHRAAVRPVSPPPDTAPGPELRPLTVVQVNRGAPALQEGGDPLRGVAAAARLRRPVRVPVASPPVGELLGGGLGEQGARGQTGVRSRRRARPVRPPAAPRPRARCAGPAPCRSTRPRRAGTWRWTGPTRAASRAGGGGRVDDAQLRRGDAEQRALVPRTADRRPPRAGSRRPRSGRGRRRASASGRRRAPPRRARRGPAPRSADPAAWRCRPPRRRCRPAPVSTSACTAGSAASRVQQRRQRPPHARSSWRSAWRGGGSTTVATPSSTRWDSWGSMGRMVSAARRALRGGREGCRACGRHRSGRRGPPAGEGVRGAARGPWTRRAREGVILVTSPDIPVQAEEFGRRRGRSGRRRGSDSVEHRRSEGVDRR